jgi:hypothetical protein
MNRLFALLLAVVLAVGLNLLSCRWGTDLGTTSIMTFAQNTDGTRPVGMFAAPFLATTPWASLLLGVLIPMALLGVGFYIALRGPKSKLA